MFGVSRGSWVAALVALLALGSGAGRGVDGATPRGDGNLSEGTPSSHDSNEVFEAAFLYLFANNHSCARDCATAYCLSVGKREDPPAVVMARLAARVPIVRKASNCGSVLCTGGLLFSVGPIRWQGTEKAQVEARYYEGPLSAATYTYDLERIGSEWEVVRAVLILIS